MILLHVPFAYSWNYKKKLMWEIENIQGCVVTTVKDNDVQVY
jgi:hypothetical protein